MKGSGSRFLRNAATLQVGGALNSAANFASAIALAFVLGARQQGLWVVSMQLYSLAFLLVSLGLLQVAVTQIASASARGNVEKVAGWLSALLKGYLVIGVLIVVAGRFLLPGAVALWRGVNPAIDPRVATWAWWLCCVPILDAPRVVVLAAMQGTRRMLVMAQVENVGELLRAFLVIAGAIATGDPWGPVVGTLAGTAIASVLAVELYRRERRRGGQGYPLPGVAAVLRGAGDVPFFHAYAQGFRFGFIRMADALGMKVLPPLIVQTFGSSAWVAYFRIAQGIMQLPLMLMQGVSRTALPALSELKGVKDHRRFRSLFFKATWMGGGLIAFGVLAALPLIPLIDGVLPPDYRRPVFLLACILAVAYVPLAFTLTLDSFYLLTNKLRVLLGISLFGLVVFTPISMWLASLYPRTGAAWGLVATSSLAFVHLGYVWWYFRHDPDLEGSRRAV